MLIYGKCRRWPPPRYRGFFSIYSLGFGRSTGATLVTKRQNFYSDSRRRIDRFAGFGRITELGGGYKGVISGGLAEIQLADGTQLPFQIGINGPNIITHGAGGFVALTYWNLKFIEPI